MRLRPVRMIVLSVMAVAATWFVARPAVGAPRTDPVQWRATLPDGPWDLAADRDGVAVTTSAQSVYVIGADGRVRWRAAVDDLVVGQPAIGRDVVVVGGAHSITALARTDGEVRWEQPRPDEAHSVAVAGPTVLVGDDSGTLAAFDIGTGAARWSVRFPGAPWSAARIDEPSGTAVVTWHQGDAPAVRAFDVRSGMLRWEAATDRFSTAPAVHRGLVVVAVGDGHRHARVEARDLVTGTLRWQTPVPASFEEGIEPAIDDRGVAVVDHFGVVSLFDFASGTLRWQRDLTTVLLETRIVLTRARVAFTSYAGVLNVLDRRDGHVVDRVVPARLGGLPVATVPAPWRPPGRLLVALRLRDWGVQLRRLP